MFYIDVDLTNPDVVYKVALEGVLYSLRFRWNTISEAWQLSVGSAGGEYVVQIKLRCGPELLERYKATSGVPPGYLYLLDTEKTYGRPGRYNLGEGLRFQLFYVNSDGT